MLNNLLVKLKILLKNLNLDNHKHRVWIYKEKNILIDYNYNNIRFALEVTPLENEIFSLSVINRENETEFHATNNGKRKEFIGTYDSFNFLSTAIYDKVKSLFPKINNIKNSNIDAKRHQDSIAYQKMPRVGIITLPLNKNIGGNLQAYALMELVRSIGCRPILINRRAPPKKTQNLSYEETTRDTDGLLAASFSMGDDVPNKRFIEENIIDFTPPYTSSIDLKNDIHKYNFDAIIVGSDQVWRPRYAKSLLSSFFMDFISNKNQNIKKISYAASFGAPSWEYNEEQTLNARHLIEEFDAISVREDSGVSLCRDNLNVNATHVLDPTLTLNADHYINKFLLKENHKLDNRLLNYILDKNDDKVKIISEVAKKLSLNIYSINGPTNYLDEAKSQELDHSVEGWLASFYNSKFVITDSFHGTVFSILFNKPFIAYGNINRGIARFTSLLKLFDLEDRLIISSSNIDIDRLIKPINWDKVNTKLDKLRADSINYLKNALSIYNINNSVAPQSRMDENKIGSIYDGQICKPLDVLCTGCGVCVSESNGTLRMAWSDDGFLIPRAETTFNSEKVIKVCPFNPNPEKEVADEDVIAGNIFPDALKFDLKAGRFESSYIGYSKEFRSTSSSGGIATYIFDKLQKFGAVDYLYVVQGDDNNGYTYKVYDGQNDIKNTSKTRYYPVTMSTLFSIIEERGGRVAVSGVACFIKAIRLKQHYHPELKKKIPFLMGIICGGLKSRKYTDYLAQSAGINGKYRDQEYRVKDIKSSSNDYSFSAYDKNNKLHEMKMKRVGDMWGTGLFKSRACDFCTDVLTELADISVGDAWLSEYKSDGMGNSVIVTRSNLADTIIRSGIQNGELVAKEVPIERVIQSQGGGFRHKQSAVKFRSWMAKNIYHTPVPVVRNRLNRDVSIPDAFVQILRERARAKSIILWNEIENSEEFRKKIKSTLLILKLARKDGVNDTLSPSQPMVRWLLRKVRGGHIDFDMIRSALLEKRDAIS